MLSVICYLAFGSIAVYGAYSFGLIIGYKRGLKYGRDQLAEYHKYSLQNIEDLETHVSEQIRNINVY